MEKVKIECPICLKSGVIDVTHRVINNSTRGITAVTVQSNIICPHSVVVYIDKHFTVRDCFVTDFTVELPMIELDTSTEYGLKKNFDLYLITINITAHTLSYILRCRFLNKKFIFIDESEILQTHLSGFLDYIFNNTFKLDNSIISMSQYRKNKSGYKDAIIFNNVNVIRDKFSILKEKRVRVEEMMVQKFLAESNPDSSLIILKNEIYKVFLIAESIINHSVKKNNPINRKLIVDHLLEKFSVGVSNAYLDFLFSVLKENFKVDVFETSTVSEFMNFV